MGFEIETKGCVATGGARPLGVKAQDVFFVQPQKREVC